MIKINNVSYINTIIEKTKFFSEKFGNVVIFTNGNCWYIPTLINNLLKSMQIHESSRKTIVFCSDKQGYDKCNELGFNHYEYVHIPELNISNILSGSSCDTKDYTRLCFVKIVIMKHILDMGYTPLYLDPDMAFLSPGIDNLLSYLDKNDFVCAGSIEYLNSNIMIAKPTDFNKKLFELSLEDFNSFLQETGYGDEDLLRPRLINKSFSCVDRTHYPNGIDSIKYKHLNLAKIIHSNCVVGLDNKIKLMKECNGWFLETNIISEEFVADVKDIYPPFLEGDLFEKYFYEYIKKNNPILNRKYINATWTNLYCNSLFKNIPFNNQKLQKELDSLPQEDKYFTIVQFDEGVKYNKLPPDTTVFGCCFGDIPIPLTYETTAFSNQKLKLWDDKSIFCSFLGGHTHILRNKVYEYVQQFSDYYYEIVKDLSVSKELYIQKSIESKFCLAPRGFGRSSFRFFEILKLGSVPVYIWDDENWLPFKDKVDYSKLCVSINIKDLEQLDSILRNITKEQYEDMVFYYKKVENLFTYEGMSKEIINTINESKPTICIVTIMIGDLCYKNKAKENHKKYCDKYGYSYICIEDKINDFHPMWMKPDLILRELKKGYDYVFWMDADSFFINMDMSFDSFLKNKHDLITAGDENDIVNTGHLLFKNTEWSIKFIEKWLGFRKPLNQSVFEKFKNITTHFYIKEDSVFLCDQPPVNLLLGGADEKYQENWFDTFNKVNLYYGNKYRKHGIEYSPTNKENLERCNSLICDSMKEHVCILEQSSMNSYPYTYKKGDFIIHFVTDKLNFNQVLEKINS
jgi:hypothetical protein